MSGFNPKSGLTVSTVRGFDPLFEQITLNWIEAEDFAHARKTPAMNWGGAQFL